MELSQGVTGWRQIFNGKISQHWLEHQGNTKTSSGKVRMNYIWGASIVEICLHMMIELWGKKEQRSPWQGKNNKAAKE